MLMITIMIPMTTSKTKPSLILRCDYVYRSGGRTNLRSGEIRSLCSMIYTFYMVLEVPFAV